MSPPAPPTPGQPPPVHRLAAFTDDPDGGNPAGVVVTDAPLTDAVMQDVAAEVGYSETAFLTSPDPERRHWRVRYFAPTAEVPFCGHATIAAGVLLGDLVGPGTYHLATRAGEVPVEVAVDDGTSVATLTSVRPQVDDAPDTLVTEALAACAYRRDQLDPRYAPAVADAGARHLLLVLRDRADLAALDYDVDRLRRRMLASDLTTVAPLWPELAFRWHARNPFPVGGVVEDPATGAAAAALGAYLRARELITPPAHLTVLQGHDMGRPSHLAVHVPPGDAGIQVSGTAVPIPTSQGPST